MPAICLRLPPPCATPFPPLNSIKAVQLFLRMGLGKLHCIICVNYFWWSFLWSFNIFMLWNRLYLAKAVSQESSVLPVKICPDLTKRVYTNSEIIQSLAAKTSKVSSCIENACASHSSLCWPESPWTTPSQSRKQDPSLNQRAVLNFCSNGYSHLVWDGPDAEMKGGSLSFSFSLTFLLMLRQYIRGSYPNRRPKLDCGVGGEDRKNLRQGIHWAWDGRVERN